MVGGLYLFWIPGKYPRPNRRLWVQRTIRTGGVLSGVYFMFMAAIELMRLQLPTDPWAEDAAAARSAAQSRGEKVSRWFGPRGYKNVEYAEWKRRVDASMDKAESVSRRVAAAKNVWSDIRDNNRSIGHRILQELQAENRDSDNQKLVELQDAVDQEAGDIDDEVEWVAVEPWENLKHETSIVVRLMPHTRGVHEDVSLMIPLSSADEHGDTEQLVSTEPADHLESSSE